jgi:hypothetical protein
MYKNPRSRQRGFCSQKHEFFLYFHYSVAYYFLDIVLIKVIGRSMKTRQQQTEANTETELQALLQQAAVATPSSSTSSILKTGERKYSIRRSLSFKLPTHSSPNMPPKKKAKTSDAPVQSKKKATNFTELEDISICRAYVNVSTNAVVGSGQKSITMWAKIYDVYTADIDRNRQYMEDNVKNVRRGLEAIKNRFDKKIKKEVRLFNPYYKRVVDADPSGTDTEKQWEMALEEFREQEGFPFQFRHCCEDLLWTCPSFDPAKLVDSNDIIDITDEDNAVDVAPASLPASSVKIKMEGKEINNTLGNVMGANMARPPYGTKAAKKLFKDDMSLVSIQQQQAAAAINISNNLEEHIKIIKKKEMRKDKLQNIASCMQEAKFLKECGDTVSYLALVDKMKSLRAELNALNASVIVGPSPPSSELTGSTDDAGTDTEQANVHEDLPE